jgi:hypothetical protein
MNGNPPLAAVINAPKKEKKPMSEAEKERNERRKAAFEELKAINPKAKWTNASKLVSYRNKGNSASEQGLLDQIADAAAAAGNAAAVNAGVNGKAPGPAAAKAEKKVVATAAKTAKKANGNAAKAAAQAAEKEARLVIKQKAKNNLTVAMRNYGKPSAVNIQTLYGRRLKGMVNGNFFNKLRNARTVGRKNRNGAKTVKKAMTKEEKEAAKNAERARRQALKQKVKNNLTLRMRNYGKKPSAINIQTLYARRLRGNNNANFFNKLRANRTIKKVPTKFAPKVAEEKLIDQLLRERPRSY